MKALLKALILLPLIVFVVGLSVANRQMVGVSLDPFTLDILPMQIEAPLYAVILASVALGVLVGGVASWLVQSKHRRAARASRIETHRLRSEVDRLRVNASPAR